MPIKVVEAVSNLPVEGAAMAILSCDFGCPFGPKVLFKGLTDKNGSCQVPKESYNTAGAFMNVTKLNYWEFETQYKSTVTVDPVGWLRLTIHKVGTYPPGTILSIVIGVQGGTRSEQNIYSIVSDSIVFMRAFGGQINNLNWQVQGATLLNAGLVSDLQIPRFDTLRDISLNY